MVKESVGSNVMAAYFSSSANLVDGTVDCALGYRLPAADPSDRRRASLGLPDTDQLTLALVMTVQKCLEPKALLNQLVEFVADFLPVRGLAWQAEGFEIRTPDFEMLDKVQKVLLSLPDQVLGFLAIDSKRALSPEEIDWLERLLDSVVYPLRNVCLYQQALATAERDALTGLKNRRAFDTAIEQELARFTRYGIHSTLVAVDLVSFKAINDTWGHDVGDEVLVRVGQGLRQVLRETDQAFRYGGDEFTAILPATHAHGAQKFAERLNHWLVQHPLVIKSGEQVPIRATIGHAQTQAESDARDWFRRADQALYESKRVRPDDPMRLAV